jgi:hypothetical protein
VAKPSPNPLLFSGWADIRLTLLHSRELGLTRSLGAYRPLNTELSMGLRGWPQSAAESHQEVYRY